MFSLLSAIRLSGGFFVFNFRALMMLFLGVALTLLSLMPLAYAQTAAPVRLNLVPFWSSVTPYILGIVAALLVWITPKVNAWLVQHKLSVIQDDFDQALEHVPGLVTTLISSVALHNPALTVPAAISGVAKIIMQMVPGLKTQLKLTPATVESYVEAKLVAVGNPLVTTASTARAPLKQ